MSTPAHPTQELLLEHVAWMRALARSLVRDVHAAEDLAQDVAVAALEEAPADPGRWRAWVRAAMWNRAADRSRARRNATARERDHARSESTPDTAELLGRVETQRRMADHLLALDEPYRTTLLLRYFEDLAPSEIAARTGAEVATVKSRLHRGLDLLRVRLDREHHGDRSAWVAALTPFCVGRPVAHVPWIGALAMNVKIWIAIGLLSATGAWWLGRGTEAVVEQGATVSLPAEPRNRPAGTATGPAPEVVDPVLASERRAAPQPTEPAPRAVPAIAQESTLRVRVLDGSARALSGHAVRIAGSEVRAQSDATGFAAFELAAERARIESADPDWITVRPAEWRRDSTLLLTVVVAPVIDVAGDVVGDWGEPLKDARVELQLPEDFARRFSDPLESTTVTRFDARSDERGAFALSHIPAIAGAVLRATREDRTASVLDAPSADLAGLRFVLSQVPREPGRALEGRVVRRDGSPATDARVALGLAMARTDARGAFAIDLARSDDAARVVAVEAGSLPGVYERGRRAWPAEIEIVLGEPCLSIEGRVVDERGDPKSGARVWIADPTPFGVLGTRPVRLEFLASGAPLPQDAVSTLADLPAKDGARQFNSARPAREPDAMIAWVVTDAEGRFALQGLQERAYTLNVLDSRLHYGTITDPIEAGRRGVVVELPPDELALHRKIRGLVVTKHGDPVANVSILPFISPVSVEERVFGGTVNVSRFFEGESVRTGADGSFELVDVPRMHVSFQLSGEGIGWAYASVEDVADPANHRFVVSARVRVEIEIADAAYADSARAADDEGRPVKFLDPRADGYSNYDELRLSNGRSGVVVLPSDAATITLWNAGELVETIAVRLVPGETARIVR
ncbi:MAG: RNA polymerase sigma factor [Planctomycetota bacterium]|nr:RNA polymerase sigma factor [Planctomycetota bacterium]